MTGAEIKAFRAQKQMSQYQLAQLVGTTQNAVSKWERNQIRPSDAYKARLEWLVHAAPDELQARRDEVRQEQAEERRKRRCANPVKPKKPAKKETAKICSNTSRKPLQGLPPLAAHGQCEKQDHVLCLHPGDRPCPDLRRGAYISAVQDAQSALSGRC